MRVRPLLLAVALLGFAITIHAAGESRQLAESLLRKTAVIQARSAEAGGAAAPLRTTVTETELNSWLIYEAPPLLPEGIARPRVSLPGERALVATAIVDLDAMAKSRASGRTFDIWNLVGGRVPVTVRGVLHATGGRGRFEVQQADISGVPVPVRVLDEVMQYYSRTADHPDGFRLSDPFELPAGITHIELRRGAAIVSQ